MASHNSEMAKKRSDAAKEFVMLAHEYNPEKHTDLTGWLVSEKLDGVRARWHKGKLWSRSKKEFPAPQFFIDKLKKLLGDIEADGELYLDHGKFQETVSIVRCAKEDRGWGKIRYIVFDVAANGPYLARTKKARTTLHGYRNTIEYHNFKFIDYHKIGKNTAEEIMYYHNAAIYYGGEGIMVRNPETEYEFGRSWNLLKVKEFKDMEVKVIGYEKGTKDGRNADRVGKLLCRMDNGKEVGVGNGLSDHERENPPKIGSIITIKYFELTDEGKPRFPSFVAIRDYE